MHVMTADDVINWRHVDGEEEQSKDRSLRHARQTCGDGRPTSADGYILYPSDDERPQPVGL